MLFSRFQITLEYKKLSKDPVIFGEIISGDFLQSAIAAIGIPQFANGPLFTSFIAIRVRTSDAYGNTDLGIRGPGNTSTIVNC